MKYKYNGLFQKLDAHPPKEDMGIPKILPAYFIGNSSKIKHFFGREGKEDMGIPKMFDRFNPNLSGPFSGCSVSIWSQSHFWRLGKLCI